MAVVPGDPTGVLCQRSARHSLSGRTLHEVALVDQGPSDECRSLKEEREPRRLYEAQDARAAFDEPGFPAVKQLLWNPKGGQRGW